MENGTHLGSAWQDSPEIPSLIKHISSNDAAGFDDMTSLTNDLCRTSESESLSPSNDGNETEPIYHRQRVHSVSISMPPSPVAVHLQNNRRVLFSSDTIFEDGIPDASVVSGTACSEPPKHHSQPIPTAAAYNEAIGGEQFSYHQSININRLKDKRYDSFKTWSGKIERQITLLRGKSPLESKTEDEKVPNREVEKNLPVHRYFDALEWPELETLKASEKMVLPDDKTWPFLLRYPISSFGICLGVSSQSIMWKALATSAPAKFLHISLRVNLVLLCISIALIATVASIF